MNRPRAAANATESIATVDDHGGKVQRMFSRIAPGYDRANRLMSFGTDIRWRREAVARLLAAAPAGSPRVLDLCAGTLDSALEIHRQFPRARIIGGDFSAGMLEEGARKLGGQAQIAIEPRRMDAHDLPVPDRELDAVFCAFGVRNLSNLPRATDEQARALRPGGKLVVLEFFRPHRMVARALHAVYNRTLLPLLGWAVTGDLEAYTYLPRSIGAFNTVGEYEALLRQRGFVAVRSTPLTMGMAWIVEATRAGSRGEARA